MSTGHHPLLLAGIARFPPYTWPGPRTKALGGEPPSSSAFATEFEHETLPSEFTPSTMAPRAHTPVTRFWNAVESRLSMRSTLRLATLVEELTVIGGFPVATVSCRAVAPAAVEVLLTWKAAPA